MEIFKIENRPFSCWLIYTPKPDEKLIQYQQDCLLKNHPETVLPVSSRLAEAHPDLIELVIDISGLISLSQLDNSSSLSPEEGFVRLLQISKSVQMAEDHLLPMNQMILHPDYLFFKDDKQSVKIIVLPFVFEQAASGFTVEDLIHKMAQAYHWQDKEVHIILQALQAGFTPRFDQFLDTLLRDTQSTGSQNQTVIGGHKKSHNIQIDAPPPGSQTGQKTQDNLDHSGSWASEQPGQGKNQAAKNIFLILGHIMVIAAAATSQYWLSTQFTINQPYRLIKLVVFVVPCLILVWTDLRLIRRNHAAQVNEVSNKQNKSLDQEISAESRTSRKQGPLQQFIQVICEIFSRKENSPVQENEQNQTVLLNSHDDHFRMAMLSEGLPGSAEESEGLRAFILIDEFIIGRDGKTVDLALQQQTIGRRHARIIRREGTFFIIDLGSKNGTSLDGRRLNKYQEYLMPDRCRLQFADVSMYFQVD